MMLAKKIYELPKPIADFIHRTGHMADERGVRVYAVGGFVRDLMLGVENFDVDLVVEGDGIAFAAECARRLNVRLISHKRFGTATLWGSSSGIKVDVTSARKEIYEKPAVLPTVFQGKIQDDLFRRDFTINAMAIPINKIPFGELIDFYGAQEDLKKGLVRALHALSFIDDPTRILRAVRFEQRFDFKIEKLTLSWIKEALRRKMLHCVQKHRLRDELILIFKEKFPLKSLKRLNDIGGFSYIAPLRYQKEWRFLFQEANKRIGWFQAHLSQPRHLDPYTIYLSLFFYPLGLKELQSVIHEFAFHKGESSRILALKQNFSKVNKELSSRGIRPSAVYRCLEPLSYETIASILVLSKNRLVHQRIEDFLFIHHSHRLGVRGEDLGQLGIKPGPNYKRILQELLYAKIDGKVTTKEEELKLARKLVHWTGVKWSSAS